MSTLFGFKNETKPKIPKNFNRTMRKLGRLFTEEVDRSILDSGSIYGWQNDKNRANPPWKKPEYYNWYSIRNGKLDISSSCSTYWFLEQQLSYDKKLDSAFQKWRCNQGWTLDLDRLSHFKFDGNLSCEWMEGATFEVDNYFDQHFIYYTPVEWDYHGVVSDIKYACNGVPVIITLHGGCDIRGGYTQPTMFVTSEYLDGFCLSSSSLCRSCCTGCDAEWLVDSTYAGWESPYGDRVISEYPCELGTEGKVGTVVVTEDGNAFCPVCGKSLLN